MRLITIPLSHYCERARWALDRCGARYDEEQHLQMFHLRPVRRAGGRHTVPVLVTPEGPLTDSADIVAYADAHASPDRRLYPEAERSEVEAFERRHASELGVEARRWAYHRLLPHRRLLLEHNAGRAPLHQRVALRLAFPFAKRTVEKHFDIDDETAARAREHLLRDFDEVAEQLADGRPYLMGDAFTAADLTFAALASVIVLPAGYGGPRGGVSLPDVDDLAPSLAEEVRELRSHPAGDFVLRLYRDERQRPQSQNVSNAYGEPGGHQNSPVT
jgi:glutathione S-transferase